MGNMRVIRAQERASVDTASVVTIGNFDGVHLGHQALIRHCREQAKTLGSETLAAVLTFEPLPLAWLRPAQAPARLSSEQQKLALLQALGMDLVWSMRFDQALADMPAAQFASEVLARDLAARCVVVGEDFRFGHAREGDVTRLREMGQTLGFEVQTVSAVTQAGQRISSSRIRELLAAGDLSGAAALLGRPFRMQGEVVRGQQLGRTLGYPTANLRLQAAPSPVQGIFAVRARRMGGNEWQDGVASLGTRPAVGGKEFLVEVHLFDFSGDLYGQNLEVELIERIRDEQPFAQVSALVAQMQDDEARARTILAARPQSSG